MTDSELMAHIRLAAEIDPEQGIEAESGQVLRLIAAARNEVLLEVAKRQGWQSIDSNAVLDELELRHQNMREAVTTARHKMKERCIEIVLSQDLPYGTENQLLNEIADAIRTMTEER